MMRRCDFQRPALVIASGAMLLVLAAAGALVARERSDAADRSRRTASLEGNRVRAVIRARLEWPARAALPIEVRA